MALVVCVHVRAGGNKKLNYGKMIILGRVVERSARQIVEGIEVVALAHQAFHFCEIAILSREVQLLSNKPVVLHRRRRSNGIAPQPRDPHGRSKLD